MNPKTRDLLCRLGTLACALAFLVIWVLDPAFSSDETIQRLIRSVTFRGLGSLVFLFVLLYLGFRMMRRPRWRDLAVVLPALAVAVNNLPILGLIHGTVWVERGELIWLFALECFLIGAFEELAFRGVFLPVLLEKRRESRKSIFWTVVWSSAAFGLIHLVNLLEGAGFGATVLQVGYSFLIGGMCAIVLLKTGNLLYCVLLHGIYDFGGGLISSLGDGALWDIPTVILTAVLAVLVTAWLFAVLLRIDPAETNQFYIKEEKTE